jgi:hypothetical protein
MDIIVAKKIKPANREKRKVRDFAYKLRPPRPSVADGMTEEEVLEYNQAVAEKKTQETGIPHEVSTKSNPHKILIGEGRTIRPEITHPAAQIDTWEDLIATAEEVLLFLTGIMRGQYTEEVLMSRMIGSGEQVIERLRKELSPKDRLKAAEMLAKRYSLFVDKMDMTVTEPVIFAQEDQLED